MTNVAALSDEALLRYYEEIRAQVSADLRTGVRFMGQAAKERADGLLTEIRRRGLNVVPIYWPN
jgi:hypothetical protein